MLFPKLAALWGRLVLVSSNTSHCPPRAGQRAPQGCSARSRVGRARGEGPSAGSPRARAAGPPGGDALARTPRWFPRGRWSHAVQSPGGALAGAADLGATRLDSFPPYWMPQPLLPALPPPSSPCAAGSCGPSGGEVKQEPAGGRGGRGWRV